MKKNLFAIGLTVLAFGACSHVDEDALADALPAEETVDLASLQSDVPIVLGTIDGSADVTTRGAITYFEEGKSYGNIGVFCVATRKIDAKAPNITWQGIDANETNNRMRVWQKNASAHVVVTEDGNGNLIWDDVDTEPHFYPNNDWYAYDFVAYHPKTTDFDYSYSAINAYITVDGSDDVFIAAGARPKPDDNLAYSRKYYTQESKPEAVPYFHFDQLVAKLNFSFKLKLVPAERFYVDSVVIENYPLVMRVRIASMVNNSFHYQPDRAGLVMTDTSDPRTRYGNMYLRNADDSSIRKSRVEVSNEDFVPVGGSLLIPPTSRNLTLRVYLRSESGQLWEVNPITVANNAGWQKAREYTIRVSLTPPSPINSNARMDGDSFDVVESPIYAED